MTAPRLTLYFAPGTSSMATHIALHEIGVPFESRPLSYAKKETRSPAFLAVNPQGQVPALLIDGRLLTEVAATLYYLARRFPEAGLLPHGDVEAEAQVISWMSFIASTVHPARAAGIVRVREVFGTAERRLGNGEWAVGRYSIADIHLFRLFWRVRPMLEPEAAAFPGLLAHHARMMAHHARMMARPAVKRTCDIEASIGYELPA